MNSPRVRVDRALWASALADAIDWTESFLASHTECGTAATLDMTAGRCEAYVRDFRKLERYRRAYAALQVRTPLSDALTAARATPIHELPESGHLVLPGTSSEGS